jgi:membrane associated rhomboid family serine protease
MYPLTPWVKRLLIANVVIHVLAKLTGLLLYEYGAFVPALVLVRPWTPFTYMFLHYPGLSHLLLNMLSLFFFGPRLEERLGGRDFMTLYVLGGLGGAAFSFFFEPQARVIGASAAVFAVLLGFALYWPRERIYIYFVIPVEAWLLVLGLVALNLSFGLGGVQQGVAHFAHLGGAAFGFGYLKWREWRRGAPRRDFQRKVQETSSATLSDRSALQRWEAIDTSALHELNRGEVDALLRKARAAGVRALSADERAFLDRMTTRH